ncbi:AAA family ATPase [Bacillus mycoides]|uniref:AAA family ATPase n=1 Tax=Bacillus mycoides TaxID=1405 RepID=UPI001F08D518|nr:ATP-binding protein [Bacillus mycoides]
MYIKSINFVNHEIYDDLKFNFCDSNGKPFKTIILAGENGTGKSTLLNVIFNFITSPLPTKQSNGKTIFVFQLSENDILSIKGNEDFESIVRGYELGNELSVTVDNSITHNWDAIKASISRKNGEQPLEIPGYFLGRPEVKNIFKSIFSDVDVNYTAQSVNSTTSLEIDMPDSYVAKSTANLAQEITQLLIDIEALDNGDFAEWADQHPNAQVFEGIRDIRMKRFKNAFNSIFPTKKYKKVVNTANGKQILFEEFGKDIAINDLSSGEKQIVFRGSFLLRNKLSTEGAIALIDEPEISLHPKWQLKILDFYKTLFTNDQGVQTSQLFFATHSPFVIHNDNRTNDKVLILRRDECGKIYIPEQSEFFNWTGEQAIKEAFDINFLQEQIQNAPKHLVITEGKTDWKHLSRALNKFRENGLMLEDNFKFLEFEDDIDMGSSNLLTLCTSLCKLRNNVKIIAVFDRDETAIINKVSINNGEDFKEWGNNVYSFTLPIPTHRASTPNICIEHYYPDEEIKLPDLHSRRLYIGNEFSSEYGLHNDSDKLCKIKNKCGENSIQIIDNGVCSISNQNTNIALSKNSFAQYIHTRTEPFNNVNFENFLPAFRIIQEIIKNDSE